MAELADAHGSGPCGVTPVQVRLLLSAPKTKDPSESMGLFVFGAGNLSRQVTGNRT